MKGKILCPAGCQNPCSRITKAKEILKNPCPAGSWRPLKCIFSGKEKRPPTAGRKPCPVRSMYGKARTGAVCGSYRARFYRSTKIRFSLILPLRESCWGVPSPNPAYAACAAEKSLKIIFRIFQKQFRFTPCFSPISERTPRTAERRFYHAKTI